MSAIQAELADLLAPEESKKLLDIVRGPDRRSFGPGKRRAGGSGSFSKTLIPTES